MRLSESWRNEREDAEKEHRWSYVEGRSWSQLWRHQYGLQTSRSPQWRQLWDWPFVGVFNEAREAYVLFLNWRSSLYEDRPTQSGSMVLISRLRIVVRFSRSYTLCSPISQQRSWQNKILGATSIEHSLTNGISEYDENASNRFSHDYGSIVNIP